MQVFWEWLYHENIRNEQVQEQNIMLNQYRAAHPLVFPLLFPLCSFALLLIP